MKQPFKEQLFTIPNLMGYFRILLIPVFVIVYLHADSPTDYYKAAVIIGISGLTDMLDGKIARKFNQITELGKALDPVADKLTQGALIVCLAMRYRLMLALVFLFVLKEGFMLVMDMLMLKKGKKLDGAMWFGKACTAVLYIVMFVLLLLPGIPAIAANILIVLCGVMMLAALILYIPVFYKMGKV